MCLMAPARVISVDGSICQVELGGRIDPASMILEPALQVGDWVLVNSGTVVRRLDPDQAEEMSAALATMFAFADEADLQALEAAGGSSSAASAPAPSGSPLSAGSPDPTDSLVTSGSPASAGSPASTAPPDSP
jgi:hydrogenase assembly chaperone HypC/HupF